MHNTFTEEEFQLCLDASGINSSQHKTVSLTLDRSGIPVITFLPGVTNTHGAELVDQLRICCNLIPGDLVMDLGECEYFSSLILGFLVSVAMDRDKENNSVYLCSAQLQIMTMLKQLGMSNFFTFTNTVETAIQKITE